MVDGRLDYRAFADNAACSRRVYRLWRQPHMMVFLVLMNGLVEARDNNGRRIQPNPHLDCVHGEQTPPPLTSSFLSLFRHYTNYFASASHPRFGGLN
jgi:hypothetical protein